MDTQYKYLKLVKYSSLLLWDIKRLSNSALKYRYDIIPLKDILSVPKIEWVEIENEKEYPILGVHAHGESVYINRVAKGRELTMKQYQKSKPMHLFYCKVRTINGQWGVVWPEFAKGWGQIVTPLKQKEIITEQLEKKTVPPKQDIRFYPSAMMALL